MPIPLILRAASVIIGATVAASLSDEATLLTALRLERFEGASNLSINARHGSGWNYSGNNDFNAPLGGFMISLPGSWVVAANDDSYLNPFYLFVTRPLRRSIVSCGIGYDFSQNASSHAESYRTCSGPGISPFQCLDTVLRRDFGVQWQRRHSLFFNMNGLWYFSLKRALVAGIEAAYKPRQGFQYEETYIDYPPELTVRYYDYNTGAWDAGVSAAIGFWQKFVLFKRLRSALLIARWDYDFQRSLPIHNDAMASYGYDMEYFRDPIIQYIGEVKPSHRFLIECSAADFNPDKEFLDYVKRPFVSPPLVTVDELKLYGQYSHSNETDTYLNRWVRYEKVELGKTYHYYNSRIVDAGVGFRAHCFFLRNAYVEATGIGRFVSNFSFWNVLYDGTAGAGVKFPVWKGLIVDLGLTFLNVRGIDDYKPDADWDTPTVHLSISLIR